MPNYILYLVLIFISIILFIFSWLNADIKKLIPLYLTMAGFIYLFEYVVLVLFKGYVYLPEIFKDKYFDSILGSSVSNGFIVPSIVVFSTVYGLTYGGVIALILSLCGIEILFLHLDVYRHFWWKTIYTGLSLPIAFILGNWLWNMIREQSDRVFLRVIVLYFTYVALKATIVFFLTASFKLMFYHVGWYTDPSRSHIAFASIFIFIKAFFYVLVLSVGKHWLWKVCLIIGDICLYIMLYNWGILEISGIWVIGLLALLETLILIYLFYINKLLAR